MPKTILQNTPDVTDLTEWGLTTGWTFEGNIATHELCNDGSIYLKTFPLIVGEEYAINFNVNSISGGNIRVYAGTAVSDFITTTGFKELLLTASGTDPEIRIYSNADCEIEIFSIKGTSVDLSLKKTNVIVWAEKNNKWSDFRTSNPDVAFSLFAKLYSGKYGDMYVHDPNSGDRNNFYGTQYKTIVKFVANKQAGETKTFESIQYKSNTLLITTTDGITTSLGQVSDLIEEDFLQYALEDGVDSVEVYSAEGNYQAGFLRDKNEDLIEGSVLKGNYATIELVTTENVVLKLFIVDVKSVKSFN